MKKLSLLLAATICCTTLLAQKENDKEEPAPQKNMAKINLLALGLKNISLQYERAVAKKVTVAGTFRFMPKGSIPFKTSFKTLADDPETEKQLDDLRVGNIAFMPEVRYYFSKKGAFRGFYLGLYANIARYSAEIPFQYDDAGITKTIPMSGNLTAITGGLMIGAQFKLGGRVYLDWWALGPGYGSSSGKLTGKKTMDASEQQDLRDELADTDIPLTKFTYMVDGNGATMDFKGPWAGIRSGICIGIRF
jgi:hypothetical protein